MRYFLILLLISLISCNQTKVNIPERIVFWEIKIMRDIPNGTSREKIEKWAKAHNFDSNYYEKDHSFHAHIERIPVKNIPDAFVCSHWDIFLKIDIDTKGLSSNTDISSAGTCI